jgi:hypothetical protein
MLVLVLGIGYLLGRSDEQRPTPRDIVGPQGASRLDAVEARLEEIAEVVKALAIRRSEQTDSGGDGENKELADRVDELAAIVASLQQQARSLGAINQTAPERSRQSKTEEEEARRERLNQLLSDTFEAEGTDQAWSHEAFAVLEDAFLAPELKGGELLSADCRSTMCRAEVYYPQGQSQGEQFIFENELLSRVAPVLPEAVVQFKHGPDGRGALMYFVRKGHGLPRLDDSASRR